MEKFFDKDLKNSKLLSEPLELTLVTNIQYIISEEIDSAINIFQATGGAALLMDVNSGEVLSLVSLPSFDINLRKNVTDEIILTKLQKVFMS